MVAAVVDGAADPVEAKGEPTEGKDGADAAEAKIDQKAEEKVQEGKEVEGKEVEGKEVEGKADAEGKAELKVEEKNAKRKVYVPPKGAVDTKKETSTRAINPGIQVSASGDLSIGGVRALRLVHEDMLRERYSVSMRPQLVNGNDDLRDFSFIGGRAGYSQLQRLGYVACTNGHPPPSSPLTPRATRSLPSPSALFA